MDATSAARVFGNVALLRDGEFCVHGLAGLAAATGDAERAARLWGAAERLRESLGNQPSRPQVALQDRYLAGARVALGDHFAPLEAEGRELSLEDAVALAATDELAGRGAA